MSFSLTNLLLLNDRGWLTALFGEQCVSVALSFPHVFLLRSLGCFDSGQLVLLCCWFECQGLQTSSHQLFNDREHTTIGLTKVGSVMVGPDGDADDVLVAGAEDQGDQQEEQEQGTRAPGSDRLIAGGWKYMAGMG